MPRDVIPFPLAKAKAAPAWDALQEFRALAATLAGAVAFRDACQIGRASCRERVSVLV